MPNKVNYWMIENYSIKMYFLEIRLLAVPANSSCVPYIAGVPNTTQELNWRKIGLKN